MSGRYKLKNKGIRLEKVNDNRGFEIIRISDYREKLIGYLK